MEKKPRVLVIDDEKLSFKLLEQIFTRENWECFWAASGNSGIELAESAKPDIILLDVVLPDKNGFEVCLDLKSSQTTKDIPVIFVTSRNDREAIVKAFEAGAVDFVTKPFFVEEIWVRVKTQLKLKQYADELKQKNEQLSLLAEKFQVLSLTDELMIIGNRRAFETEIERVHNQSARLHQPYSLLIADIDFFKKFNDYFGHQAGDRVLRTLGEVFKSSVRSYDFVARYGGEEIVVILPQTGCNEGMQVAQRIQRAIAEKNIVHPGNPPHSRLTVSMGLSCFDPDKPDFSYYEVIRKADQALYQAKSSGRNSIRVFKEEA